MLRYFNFFYINTIYIYFFQLEALLKVVWYFGVYYDYSNVNICRTTRVLYAVIIEEKQMHYLRKPQTVVKTF